MTWMPFDMSVISVGGMSCYGTTGAFMMEAYGFLVKVIWKFLDVLFIPVLVKIRKGNLTVGGAAGNMDNMLGLMMKFVGVRLELVALVIGRVLMFMVSILLLLMTADGGV